MKTSSKDMQSPILLYGDSYLSKRIIAKAKKKYHDADWIVLPAKEDSDANAISVEISSGSFNDTQKILIINNLANRKNMREFILSIAKGDFETKLIVWDSENTIKVDPKTNAVSTATWKSFVNVFEELGKVVNSGAYFTIKQTSDCVNYVQTGFKLRGHAIDHDASDLFVKLVGLDRGLLSSEMDKLSLIAPNQIHYPFVLDNTFASSKEAVLYVLSNALDKESESHCICLIEEFMDVGINENVIAEILMTKVRWHLVVADLFNNGIGWDDIPSKLMGMGKFPSGTSGETKYELLDGINHLCTEKGMNKRYFTQIIKTADSKTKMKKSAMLPIPFMAHDAVRFIKTEIFNNMNVSSKDVLLDRTLVAYLRLHQGLFDIRKGNAIKNNLFAMVRDLKDPYLC